MNLPHRYENIGSAVLIPTKHSYVNRHTHTHVNHQYGVCQSAGSAPFLHQSTKSLLLISGGVADGPQGRGRSSATVPQSLSPFSCLLTSWVLVKWKAVFFICTCARHTPARTPDSWRNSTSGKCSGTSPFAFQSWCCDLSRSRGGRSRRCRAMSGCRPDLGCRRSPSADWGHRNWATFRNKPDLALLGAWSSCTWVSGSPPIHGTPCASPPPSPRRCRTCPSCSSQ